MANQIFVSYSKKDKDFAWKLADDLADAGHEVWIDRSIEGGEDWRATIEKNLKESDEVVIVVSPNSMASEWVKHEGSLAYGWGKKLLPILLEIVPALPPWLEEYQWIDFEKTDYQTALASLVKTLTLPNPMRSFLDQKHHDYETYQFLLEPKELEIVADQLNSPGLNLSEADKRLLLYSAVAHNLGQYWMPLAGENGIQWLREACQDERCPAIVWRGAAASLGEMGDEAAFEQLGKAVQDPTGSLKGDALDLLAEYLHRFPREPELSWPFWRATFPRLARLRVRDGAGERRRMRRMAMATALVCVIILYTWVVATDPSGVDGFDLFIFSLFGVMGVFAAYIFAEMMTSLRLLLIRQSFVWRALALLVAGSIVGYLLFFSITITDDTWPIGGLIGLILAVLENWRPPRPKLTRWGLGGIAGILAAFVAYLLLKPTFADIGEVVSAALFTAVYVLWSVRT